MKMPYTGVSPPPSRARALIRSILLGCSLIYKKAKYINHLGKYYLCAPPYVYIYILPPILFALILVARSHFCFLRLFD